MHRVLLSISPAGRKLAPEKDVVRTVFIFFTFLGGNISLKSKPCPWALRPPANVFETLQEKRRGGEWFWRCCLQGTELMQGRGRRQGKDGGRGGRCDPSGRAGVRDSQSPPQCWAVPLSRSNEAGNEPTRVWADGRPWGRERLLSARCWEVPCLHDVAVPAGVTRSHPVVLSCTSPTISNILLVTPCALSCTCRPIGCLLGYNVCSELSPPF